MLGFMSEEFYPNNREENGAFCIVNNKTGSLFLNTCEPALAKDNMKDLNRLQKGRVGKVHRIPSQPV